jgi:hypothetical protein
MLHKYAKKIMINDNNEIRTLGVMQIEMNIDLFLRAVHHCSSIIPRIIPIHEPQSQIHGGKYDGHSNRNDLEKRNYDILI